MSSTDRKQALLITLAVLVSCASSPPPRPFTSDGCSRFPDGTIIRRTLWRDCCLAHDKAYWRGGARDERREADHHFKACVSEVQSAPLGFLMYRGVRFGGGPWWPTSYRWGYGWPYGRGYRPLSPEEQSRIDELLDGGGASQVESGETESP